jgi:hypothetical protein
MTVEYLRQRTIVSHAILTREAKALEILNALCMLIKRTQVHKLHLCFQTLHVHVRKLKACYYTQLLQSVHEFHLSKYRHVLKR